MLKMYSFLLIFAISPVFTSVTRNRISSCSANEFACGDGGCVNNDYVCDGFDHCDDGSDETACYKGTFDLSTHNQTLDRSKRQSTCTMDQWKCSDGTCISFYEKCDGVIDCSDGSDETHPLCRNTPCQKNWFRCTYGACVDGTAPCNGVKECADNSDELLPRCRDETVLIGDQYKCQDGSFISSGSLCDGEINCADGSDEVISACADFACPSYLFQCAYGACVDRGSDCNDIKECADNSDESDELCNRTSPITTTTSSTTVKVEPAGGCVLPEYPAHGSYSVKNMPNAVPGEAFHSVVLEFTCEEGYGVEGRKELFCLDGWWPDEFPKCIHCGTVVSADEMIIGGRQANRGELPWHVGIYRQDTTSYMQICGGSLIRTTMVISAAHCFWIDEDEPIIASMYAVAAGKVYRWWDHPEDKSAQKSDVRKIMIPEHFRGGSTHFQDDIALVATSNAFVYKIFVRPVCLDFNIRFEDAQLTDGNLGKVGGWGYETEDGDSSKVLKVTELPFVDTNACFDKSPLNFRAYITSDKICAGYANGTAVCKGDSGGGLVFPQHDRITERFYLRGIVSTAPRNEHLCNAFALSTFTQVSKHEKFIKRNVIGD